MCLVRFVVYVVTRLHITALLISSVTNGMPFGLSSCDAITK